MEKKKLFDFVIGNPPYNEDFGNSGDNGNYAKPVYNIFMDAVNQISNNVELIHPARFLFNAGSTPKSWNEKMLNDPHFKVIKYCDNASSVFANTDIKGGIAITYRNLDKNYGAIGTFTPYDEINTTLHKVLNFKDFIGMNTIAITGYAYHFTENLYIDHPELKGRMSKGHEYDFKSNVFEKMPDPFEDELPSDGKKYIKILGREGNKRAYKYILREYVNDVKNLNTYKVFIPRGSGTGRFGEELSEPVLGIPGEGATETFLSIGCFKTEIEAKNTIRYIKTKFVRSLISILKVTQIITPGVWKYVPLQNFSNNSDIDWSKSIHEIDLQLYKKYGLDHTEIDFIESHVKEMD